jgi:hypothetical protein
MSTFDDIKFKQHPLGSAWAGIMSFDDGTKLSVVCGPHFYCEPKLSLRSPNEYNLFEIAILNTSGDFITEKFVEGADQVIGWQSREDLNKLIIEIETKITDNI